MGVEPLSNILKYPIGGVFGARRVDVQLAHGLHDGGGEQKLVFNLECCSIDQVRSHLVLALGVMESLGRKICCGDDSSVRPEERKTGTKGLMGLRD